MGAERKSLIPGMLAILAGLMLTPTAWGQGYSVDLQQREFDPANPGNSGFVLDQGELTVVPELAVYPADTGGVGVPPPNPSGVVVDMEIEVKEVGTAFDGTNVFPLSVGLDSWGTVAVANLPSGVQYHWRARVVGQSWQEYGTSGADFETATATFAHHLDQTSTSSGNSIPLGGTASGNKVTLKADVVSVGGSPVDVTFEVTPTDEPFTSPNMVSITVSVTDFPAHAAAPFTLLNGKWRWRVVVGPPGTDFEFGANGTATDFAVNMPVSVQAVNPDQYQQTTGFQIPLGGDSETDGIDFKSMMVDLTGSGLALKLGVEIAPVGEPYSGEIHWSDPVLSGTEAVVAVTGLFNGQYRWRAWAMDDNGNITADPVPYFTDDIDAVDFSIIHGAPEPPDPPEDPPPSSGGGGSDHGGDDGLCAAGTSSPAGPGPLAAAGLIVLLLAAAWTLRSPAGANRRK